MQQTLNHTAVRGTDGSPTQWLYILHGIYGSGRNWGSIARQLVEESADWGVMLVDLRLHGGSTGFPPPHTLRASADDVARLEEQAGLTAQAILGHSFGGKVALLRAADPAESLSQVWIADSTLRSGPPSGTAWKVIEIVRSLPNHFASRDEVADALVAHGYERGVGQWLAMNLERAGSEFRWRLDWEGVEEMLRDYFATDVWPIIEDPPEGTDIHIIKASQSDAIDAATLARLSRASSENGRVHVHTVQGGHWLNVENPEAVLRLLQQELVAGMG